MGVAVGVVNTASGVQTSQLRVLLSQWLQKTVTKSLILYSGGGIKTEVCDAVLPYFAVFGIIAVENDLVAVRDSLTLMNTHLTV